MAGTVLILGVGNILLSDEGAGVRVVEGIRQRYLLPDRVQAIDGGTMGLDLLPYLEGTGHLCIVDAIRSADLPGSLLVKELVDPPAYFRQKISPHQIGLSELLAVATLQDCLPPRVTLFGIVPQRLTTGIGLSEPVAAAVEKMIPLLVAHLAGLGVSPLPQAGLCHGFC